MNKEHTLISKFLSYVLRHKPESIGLTLDAEGWASLDELLRQAQRHGQKFNEKTLRQVVADSDKQRFALDDERRRIRANQGHSVQVDLALEPVEPPQWLYHGTATRFVGSIRGQGLKPGERQHVHLSADEATAVKVGQRHGKPQVLRVRAGDLARAGQSFYLSANGVWLTEKVPVEFIDFGDAGTA